MTAQSMTVLADAVASAVLAQFAKLPPKRKPAVRDNGLHEWVPLSGIVAERDGQFTCVALATGMKCLPASKLPESKGVGIHDWHAEVLAIRALNRFVLDEYSRILGEGESSILLQRSSDPIPLPASIREDVKLHMYCSEAPCGDASMELTMAAQEDPTPWEDSQSRTPDAEQSSLPGRGFFSQLGIVRRKPARGDAPPTMSKSCSDKLAAKQCLSLLSSTTSLFVSPLSAYIDTLVLPESRYSAEGCSRAFSSEGRMKPMADTSLSYEYKFTPFKVSTTTLEFDYSKVSVERRSTKISASNLAAVWTLSGVEETILGGVVQGRRPFLVSGASQLSRRAMWAKAIELGKLLEAVDDGKWVLDLPAYRDFKAVPALKNRTAVKQAVRSKALSGWVQNSGDDDFRLA